MITNARSCARPRASSAEASEAPFAELELPYTPPFDWPRLLRFFAGRATPGVEAVQEGVYRRVIDYRGASGILSVRAHARRPCLVARLDGPVAAHADDALRARLAALFDLRADPHAIGAHLARDAWLAPLLGAAPVLRVPGAWSGFELAVRAIVGQQVSVKAATTLIGRLVARAGEPIAGAGALAWRFPEPDALARCDLAQIGMPGKRVAALQGMARAVAAGDVPLWAPTDDRAALRAAWLALPGIGVWTVEYIAMRAWRDPDAWPGTDLVLMQQLAARDPACTRPADQRRRSEAWRPWRAYAALHLWNDLADRAQSARGG